MGWNIKINNIDPQLIIRGKHRLIEGYRTNQEVTASSNLSDSFEYCRQLSKTLCNWMITPSSTPISTYCFSAEEEEGLSETLSSSESNTAAKIKNHGDNTNDIYIWIVVPSETFNEIWDICKVMYTTQSVSLMIAINFIGFKQNGVVNTTPSITEFKGGKPYYFDDVSIYTYNNILDKKI